MVEMASLPATSKWTAAFKFCTQVFTLWSHLISAGGTEALPGQRRKCPGHARWRRRNEIWHQYQLSPGGVWNNGQQWCILKLVLYDTGIYANLGCCFFNNCIEFCGVCFLSLCVTAADAVVRNVYYKYFHPKEALVSNGVLNRFVVAAYFYHTITHFILYIPVSPSVFVSSIICIQILVWINVLLLNKLVCKLMHVRVTMFCLFLV